MRRAAFGAVHTIVLFFEDNFAEEDGGDADEDEKTRVAYLGFKGEWMPTGRAPVGITYEAAANPSDHKVKGVGVMGAGRIA